MKKRSNVTSVLPPQKWGASPCVLSRLGPLQKTGAVVTTSSEMKISPFSLSSRSKQSRSGLFWAVTSRMSPCEGCPWLP